jgi:hypothetical protein
MLLLFRVIISVVIINAVFVTSSSSSFSCYHAFAPSPALIISSCHYLSQQQQKQQQQQQKQQKQQRRRRRPTTAIAATNTATEERISDGLMSEGGVVNGDGEIAGSAAAYETNKPDAIAKSATMITNEDNFDVKSAVVNDRNENNEDGNLFTDIINGRTALTLVSSLARSMGDFTTPTTKEDDEYYDGHAKEEEEEEEEEEYYDDADGNTISGFNKGAYGIANVFFSSSASSSDRSENNKRSRTISGMGGVTTKKNHDRRRKSKGGGGGGGGRMTQLVNALQSSSSSSSRRRRREQSIITPQQQQQEQQQRQQQPRSKSTNNNNAKKDKTLITTALLTLEQDMTLLDNMASSQPQLSGTEVGLLLGAIAASGVGPIFFPGTSVTEVLAPAAAAFTAAITIGSEYIGRVAVADGKEIAANTIQCAAEAEAFLANAERVKAITPLCVGVGATCASFALLTPTIVDALQVGNSVILITELYLLCPLISVLAAAVANLALEETRGFATRAINVGVRRFSKRSAVGRTWLSSVEMTQRVSRSKTDRWWSFAGSVLPAPIIGSFVGGPSLSAKCIIVAALAAAQSAYFLAQVRYILLSILSSLSIDSN